MFLGQQLASEFTFYDFPCLLGPPPLPKDFFYFLVNSTMGFPGGSGSKESACNAVRPRFDLWFRKISWRREWLPTPVVLPGKSHGQKTLVGYSPWGCKELDMNDHTHTHKLSHTCKLFLKDSQKYLLSRWFYMIVNPPCFHKQKFHVLLKI